MWCCSVCSASVSAGGGPTEEPDPAAVNQTLHRPPTSSRSLLSDGPQLQAEDCAEKGEEAALPWLLPLSFPFNYNSVSVRPGVFDRQQDICASPQRRRRLQQTQHTHFRWAARVRKLCQGPPGLWWAAVDASYSQYWECFKNETRQLISCFLTGTSSVQSSKVGTPVSLTAQRFTVQIPPSQTATTKTSKIKLRIKVIGVFHLHLNDIIRTLGMSASVVSRFNVSSETKWTFLFSRTSKWKNHKPDVNDSLFLSPPQPRPPHLPSQTSSSIHLWLAPRTSSSPPTWRRRTPAETRWRGSTKTMTTTTPYDGRAQTPGPDADESHSSSLRPNGLTCFCLQGTICENVFS